MSNNFGYLDIILLAMIAGFIILRLRNILGRRTGHQDKVYGGFSEKEFDKFKEKIKSKTKKPQTEFDKEERKEFLKAIGLQESSLSNLIKQGYSLLDLITFFTSGPKESRAWSVKKGTLAPDAGAKIHTDFKKGFIRAEVISFQDFLTFNGELSCREKGKLRLEGKEYEVCDGDVITFRFNV